MIEQLDDIIESLANAIGVFGEARSTWTSRLRQRILAAVEAEAKLNSTITLGELVKIEVGPTDQCVLKLAHDASREEIQDIGAVWDAYVGSRLGKKLLVLPKNATLQVLTNKGGCPHGVPWDDCPDCRH